MAGGDGVLLAEVGVTADTPSPDELAELEAEGFGPSKRTPGLWTDYAASGRDYPLWRALELARRDARREENGPAVLPTPGAVTDRAEGGRDR